MQTIWSVHLLESRPCMALYFSTSNSNLSSFSTVPSRTGWLGIFDKLSHHLLVCVNPQVCHDHCSPRPRVDTVQSPSHRTGSCGHQCPAVTFHKAVHWVDRPPLMLSCSPCHLLSHWSLPHSHHFLPSLWRPSTSTWVTCPLSVLSLYPSVHGFQPHTTQQINPENTPCICFLKTSHSSSSPLFSLFPLVDHKEPRLSGASGFVSFPSCLPWMASLQPLSNL